MLKITTPNNIIDLEYILKTEFDLYCGESIIGSEWTFHQIAPYIGKIKSSIAKFLIEKFTKKGDTIYDPFCGAGTIPFEGWALGRNVVANDLNYYAFITTVAKLNPPSDIETVKKSIETYSKKIEVKKKSVDLRKIPSWVQSFFHKETLREIIAWIDVLKSNDDWFLLACLMGILHHQRPGFLSFPSSHTVPYLRINKFPIKEYPELYEYRNVEERLKRKAIRAFKRLPILDANISRKCFQKDASRHKLKTQIDAIITSPPYMRQLDYGRDNRLRLWFLGVDDYKSLDQKISPRESSYIEMMTKCLISWHSQLKVNGKCILFLGDNFSKKEKLSLPDIIQKIAEKELKLYKVLFKHVSLIPNNRRVRRHMGGNKSETILVLEKIKNGNHK